MAAVASGSVELDYSPGEIYRGETDPETPEDGQVVLNTTENVLKRWDATAEAYTIIADYNTMMAQIEAVADATVNSDIFDTLVKSIYSDVTGLHVTAVSGQTEVIVAPNRVGLWRAGKEGTALTERGLEADAVLAEESVQIGAHAVLKARGNGVTLMLI